MRRFPHNCSRLGMTGLTIFLLLRVLNKHNLPRCSSPGDWLAQGGACKNIRNQGKAAYWRLWPPAQAGSNAGPLQRVTPTTSWYGNYSDVGGSPYDFQPRLLRPDERRTRILFLLDFKDYLERMNSHSYEIVDAALRHPRVEVDVWGEGWSGWNASIGLANNLAARVQPGQHKPLGCGYYDFFWSISNYPGKHSKNLDIDICGTVHVHQIGDCHSDECIGAIYDRTGNITASKYAFEHLDMLSHDRLANRYPSMQMQLFTHSPDAANPWDYFPLSEWSRKTAGAVLFGATQYRLYHLRHNVNVAISANKTFISQFSHPGYYIDRKRLGKPLLSYQPGHASYRPQIKTREAFATGMRQAQICIFDSSVEKKAIRKFAQAFLSGCVVASDFPTEHEPAFRNFIIPLRAKAGIDEINAIVYRALMDPDELQRKALAAFTDVERYKAGIRGYSFSNAFSLSCRTYWMLTVPWCTDGVQSRVQTFKASSPVYQSMV